jgi:diacylglycerol kinase (ATP)
MPTRANQPPPLPQRLADGGQHPGAKIGVSREPASVDLIVAEDGVVVVNSVHLGVGAQAGLEASALKPPLGRLAYAAGALVAGLRPRVLRVNVTVDGVAVVREGEHIAQVAVANGSMVGGGTELAPGADPGDGLLDIVVSGAVGPWARLGYLFQVRLGRHVERPDVAHLRGTDVAIEGRPFYLSADGELSGPHTTACWRLARGALRMHI